MTAIHDGLFELDADGTITLIGGYSPTSGQFHFPLLDTCPYSGATDVERVLLSRDATLWAWTAVTAAPPGYDGPVPYGFGVVELVARAVCASSRDCASRIPAQLSFGQPMTLVADELPERNGHVGVRVSIAGVGIHPFGRFDGVTNTDMGVHAVRAALAEAGNPPFQAAFCGTAYGGVASGHKVLGALALTGVPIVDVEAGCASGGAALQLAAGAIRAGQYDCALVFGVEKMPKGIIRSSFFEPWREEAGLAATPAYFALRAQRLLREAGLTKEHLAAGRREEPRIRRAQPERDVPQAGHGRGGARVARRVRAVAPLDAVLAERRCGRGRAAARRRAASSSRRRGCVRTSPAACSARRRRCRASTTPRSLPRRRSRHATRTRRPASARATSTSSSARTPTPPASCSRTRSSNCARRASRRRLLAEPRRSR